MFWERVGEGGGVTETEAPADVVVPFGIRARRAKDGAVGQVGEGGAGRGGDAEGVGEACPAGGTAGADDDVVGGAGEEARGPRRPGRSWGSSRVHWGSARERLERRRRVASRLAWGVVTMLGVVGMLPGLGAGSGRRDESQSTDAGPGLVGPGHGSYMAVPDTLASLRVGA